jgi:hypothetical protein
MLPLLLLLFAGCSLPRWYTCMQQQAQQQSRTARARVRVERCYCSTSRWKRLWYTHHCLTDRHVPGAYE